MGKKRMRAIFYQPPGRHPGLQFYRGTPSGLLREALAGAGCQFSESTDAVADAVSELSPAALRESGSRQAEKLLGSFRADASECPRIWITVGLCPHAPDWVGPRVSRELSIPYVLLEPQVGTGTSELAVAEEKESAKNAVKAADAIVATRSVVTHALATMVPDASRLIHLLPFQDLTSSLAASHLRSAGRNELVTKLNLSGTAACLVTDGPQEPGPSLDDWHMLARALSRIVMLDWQLVILDGGIRSEEVCGVLRSLPPGRVHYRSEPAPSDRLRVLAGSDLYVCPGTGDGMLTALLEAQATGTPVVACDNVDVADRVLDGQTGRLAAANAESLANGLGFLLRHPEFRESYARQARETAVTRHDIGVAAVTLRGIISQVCSASEA